MQAAVSSSSSCAAHGLHFPLHGLHFPLPAFARRTARRGMQLASSSVDPAAASSCSPSRGRLLSPLRAFSSSTATDGSGKGDEPSAKPWLLVGLGNPGKMYQGTRHNVGFEMLDAIAEAEGISMSSVRFKAMFGKGSICNVPIILAKPQTFMNASGWVNCLIS